MTALPRRVGALSIGMIVASIGVSVAISIAMDFILVAGARSTPFEIAVAVVLFNATVILMSGVGALIEWRRPGHAIGRLLMVSGPLYAYLGLTWLTGDSLEPALDPSVYRLVNKVSAVLSWAGVAFIVGWIPLLFPTGSLPGPRWRIPAVSLALLFGACLAGLTAQSGITATTDPSTTEAALANLTSAALLALVGLAMVAVVVRYRRGAQVERLQIRWFATAVALCAVGFAGAAIESAIRTDDGPVLSTLVLYAGILAMPITIGIAVTRYRLYEIDRLISRTIGWATVTGVLVALFTGSVLALQALLSDVTQGQTLAVAASTLVAFALFQPIRTRVQRAVDRRFDRARYDGERTAAAFAERLRDQVDLVDLEVDFAATVGAALRPTASGLWLRPSDGGVARWNAR